jgi:hypothetical protein
MDMVVSVVVVIMVVMIVCMSVVRLVCLQVLVAWQMQGWSSKKAVH